MEGDKNVSKDDKNELIKKPKTWGDVHKNLPKEPNGPI